MTLTELAKISTAQLCAAIFSAPIIGRLMMVATIGLFPYARPEGMGKAFAQFTTRRTIIFAALQATLLLTLTISVDVKIFVTALVATSIATLVTWKFATFATEKIGGVTGDIYGAVTTLSETSVLITFAFASAL